MWRRIHRLDRRILVPLAGILLVLGLPATGGADPPGLGTLRQKSAELRGRVRSAVIDLYALESSLARSRREFARLDAVAANLERRKLAARLRYRAARETMTKAHDRLGRQLRLLYEHGEPDPFAILLGASSLDEAIEGLENLSRSARATESVLMQAREARARVQHLRRELRAKAERTRSLRDQAKATAAELERARADRSAYLSQLRREQALTASQIADLERRAQEAERRAREVAQQAATAPPASAAAEPSTAAPAEPGTSETTAPPPAAPAPDPSEPPPPPVESVSEPTAEVPSSAAGPPRPGGTMTVFATAYCLTGTTATGLPVGPGVVAVDPAVIPLGTRMTIPGYGEGVAADTGGAIKGKRIDVWIASCAEALAFTRTVTITFH